MARASSSRRRGWSDQPAGQHRAEDAVLAAGVAGPRRRAAGLAHRVSWPEVEVVLTCRLDELAATVAERGLDRHTIILIGPALEDDGPGVSPP